MMRHTHPMRREDPECLVCNPPDPEVNIPLPQLLEEVRVAIRVIPAPYDWMLEGDFR